MRVSVCRATTGDMVRVPTAAVTGFTPLPGASARSCGHARGHRHVVRSTSSCLRPTKSRTSRSSAPSETFNREAEPPPALTLPKARRHENHTCGNANITYTARPDRLDRLLSFALDVADEVSAHGRHGLARTLHGRRLRARVLAMCAYAPPAATRVGASAGHAHAARRGELGGPVGRTARVTVGSRRDNPQPAPEPASGCPREPIRPGERIHVRVR